VRLVQRLLVATAVGVLPVGVVVSSCGTDAVAIQQCRDIENARCNAAPVCHPGFDSAQCQRWYRDECLLGIENVDGGSGMSQPCVDAINLAAACAAGDASASDCMNLIPDATCPEVQDAATACNVILNCPEVLSACSFVAPKPSAGDGGDAAANPAQDAASDATDASDASSD
jgi:hypothetical protein